MTDQPLSPCRTMTKSAGLAPSCIIRAKMLRSIDAYSPGIGHSPLEETFERHANDYGLTEADIDAFRKVFVKEISATYPDAGRKCEAWNIVLHHAFAGLKRAIAVRSSRSSARAGTRSGPTHEGFLAYLQEPDVNLTAS